MCMLAMRRVIRWSENAAFDAARAAPERTRSPSVSTTLASRVRERRPSAEPTVRRSMRFPPATTTTAAPAAAATRASETIEKRLQRRASGDAAAPAAAEATVLPGHNSLPPPVLHSEYARGSSDDVTASGKIRHHSIDEMVINPHNHHRYRHGSSWHEAHNIPASELKEGPGKEYVSHAHHHKPGEKTAGVSDLARALAAVAEDAGDEPTAAEKHRLTSKLRKDHEHLLLFDERTELFSMPAADVSAASPVHEPPGRGWAWWATCGLCGGGAPTLDGKDFLVLEQWVPLSDVGAVEFECVTLGAPPPGLLVEVEHSAAVQLRAVVGFGGGRQLTLQFADDQGASLFQRAIRTSLFGPPEAPSGKWRSKASDATHATTNLSRKTE